MQYVYRLNVRCLTWEKGASADRYQIYLDRTVRNLVKTRDNQRLKSFF